MDFMEIKMMMMMMMTKSGDFLMNILTGNEDWFHHFDLETK
jgi:hypothetical protein